MRTTTIFIAAALGLAALRVAAQETKPVPKDSVRVSLPGCTKGYIFTAGARTVDEPGNFEIPPGTHLRMNGPKKLINEIKASEGSMVEITGVMKKGQFREGVNLGGGVRIAPAPAGGGIPGPTAGQIMIDVEGWRPVTGSCPSR